MSAPYLKIKNERLYLLEYGYSSGSYRITISYPSQRELDEMVSCLGSYDLCYLCVSGDKIKGVISTVCEKHNSHTSELTIAFHPL